MSEIGVNLDSYSKGEFGLGQHELNVKYAEILEMAD
jgi:glutamine synthetase